MKNFIKVISIVFCGLFASCEKMSDSSEPLLVKEATLVASNGYMLEMAPGQTRAAVYLKLENKAPKVRSINLVSADVAGYAEVHQHLHENGIMKMRKVEHPKVGANTVLSFEPSGYHIMLFDVAERPLAGSQIDVVFAFDGAEELKVKVDVKSVH